MSSTRRTMIDPDIANEVAVFLRTHPNFLCEYPDLYEVLTPPERVHGESVVDHMAAMIRAARVQTNRAAATTQDVVLANRAASGLVGRVQGAVLALMRAPDVLECIAIELPGLLGIDAASMCVEADRQGARTIPAGMVKQLLRGKESLLRQVPTETRMLHGEAAGLARVDALIRVELADTEGLLALAVRDRELIKQEGGLGALGFLGRAVSAALEREGWAKGPIRTG